MTDKPVDVSNGISPLPAKKDTFLVKPFILVAVLFFLQMILMNDEQIFILTFPIFLSMPIIAAVFLYLGIKSTVRRRYKSAASLILTIPILILALGFPGVSEWARTARYVNYYLRLTLHEKQYLEEVKLTQPDDKGFRYTKFIWNGRYGDGNETVLVYDESDALDLPQPQGYDPNCPYLVYKIKSHFYVVRVICG